MSNPKPPPGWPYPENRTQRKARLLSERRWKQFLAKREELYTLYPGDHKKVNELLAGDFAPLDPTQLPQIPAGAFRKKPPAKAPERPQEAVPELDPALWANKPPSSPRKDILWVYEHLEVRCTPEDSPSAGAWAMRQWARRNRDKFWREVLPRVLPTKPATEEPDRGEYDDADRDILATCHRLAELAEEETAPERTENVRPKPAFPNTPD